MELKITSSRENKTIGRREIGFSVFSESGIKREALKAELCKALNASPSSTIIVRIDSSFGSKMSTGLAHSYQSEDALKRYENRGLLERLGIIQKEPKAAAPKAEAPAPAAPAKAEERKEA
jgi:ribosomal protein S24E